MNPSYLNLKNLVLRARSEAGGFAEKSFFRAGLCAGLVWNGIHQQSVIAICVLLIGYCSSLTLSGLISSVTKGCAASG
jgi:hypothetical protein